MSPDEAMELLDRAVANRDVARARDALFSVIEDVRSSYTLSMTSENIDPATVKTVDLTVFDYLANHYGDTDSGVLP